MDLRATVRAVAVLASIALLSACAHRQSQVSKVDALYVQRLNNRLAQYNQTAAEMDADLKRQAEATANGLQSTAGTTTAANPNLPEEISRAAEVRARAAILSRFMREAAASGQFGLMSSWLQTQATELVRFSKDTDTAIAAFGHDLASAPHAPDVGARFYKLLIERGSERGAGEELITINTDLQGYERDYAGAAAIDKQRHDAAMRLLAAYLSAPRINVQAPPAMQAPTFTTCMRNGPFVNCMSP